MYDRPMWLRRFIVNYRKKYPIPSEPIGGCSVRQTDVVETLYSQL